MITALEPNQIFVFGSNLGGVHAGGAALQACNEFKAEAGIGEGLTGKCYAFPTLDIYLKRRTAEDLQWSVREFYRVAKENPKKEFLMTAVGTGIAGYDPDFMKGLFENHPANVVLPEEWK